MCLTTLHTLIHQQTLSLGLTVAQICSITVGSQSVLAANYVLQVQERGPASNIRLLQMLVLKKYHVKQEELM